MARTLRSAHDEATRPSGRTILGAVEAGVITYEQALRARDAQLADWWAGLDLEPRLRLGQPSNRDVVGTREELDLEGSDRNDEEHMDRDVLMFRRAQHLLVDSRERQFRI